MLKNILKQRVKIAELFLACLFEYLLVLFTII